jgi:hypothetical protein
MNFKDAADDCVIDNYLFVCCNNRFKIGSISFIKLAMGLTGIVDGVGEVS